MSVPARRRKPPTRGERLAAEHGARRALQGVVERLASRSPSVPKVSLERSTAAGTYGVVKISVEAPASSIQGAGADAEAEFDRLCAKYPLPARTAVPDDVAKLATGARVHAARAKKAAALQVKP